MFQKELGQKIIGKFLSPNYGRLSILTNLRLNISETFLVKPNSFINFFFSILISANKSFYLILVYYELSKNFDQF